MTARTALGDWVKIWLGHYRWRFEGEQGAAEWKQFSTPPIGEEPEVADAGKAAGQDVLHEAPQELLM